MKIEEELFQHYEIDKNKLIKYGFKEKEGQLFLKKNILDDKFVIIIEYNKTIKGKVIDTDFNEEYTNFRREVLGEFSTTIKEEFIKLLINIRETCATKDVFKFPQTKRINNYIDKEYKIKPEFLWERFPRYAIFRENKKWFALIGNVSYNKVNKKSNRKEEIEIINVKAPENEVDMLLNKKGYYEAYHMNKRTWISIILDDTLKDEEIEKRINKSYLAINEPQIWLIPANPNYYDIIHCFDNTNEIIWKQSTDIHIGDIVYLYVASPYSKIFYHCKVKEKDIPYSYQDKSIKIQKVMKIQLINRLDHYNYDCNYLKNLGIKTIRGPRKITKEISKNLKN